MAICTGEQHLAAACHRRWSWAFTVPTQHTRGGNLYAAAPQKPGKLPNVEVANLQNSHLMCFCSGPQKYRITDPLGWEGTLKGCLVQLPQLWVSLLANAGCSQQCFPCPFSPFHNCTFQPRAYKPRAPSGTLTPRMHCTDCITQPVSAGRMLLTYQPLLAHSPLRMTHARYSSAIASKELPACRHRAASM